MAKKTNIVDDKLEALNKNTQETIANFLGYYAESSQKQYKTALSNMFFDLLSKEDVKTINYNDLLTIKNSSLPVSKKDYMISFIKYLYGFDIIKGKQFDLAFNKKEIIRDFDRLKRRTQNRQNKKGLTKEDANHKLDYETIIKIIEILNDNEANSKEILKYSFYWHLLYDLGIEVSKIKRVNLEKDYDGEYLKIGNQTYKIEEKYIELLDELSARKYGDSIVKLNVYEVKKLGDLVDVNNLVPQDIINARNNLMLVKCPRCFNSYLNNSDEWFSINNVLVCKECANDLKKNGHNVKPIANEKIPVFEPSKKEKLEITTQSYDELFRKINNIDYLQLHKRQMEIGALGEAFVYDLECNKLKHTNFVDRIDRYKALDPSNGYDILSFDNEGNELYIEVKTTIGDINEDFFISSHEINTAKKLISQDKKYYIYRVYNILANNKNEIGYYVISDFSSLSLVPEHYRIANNK